MQTDDELEMELWSWSTRCDVDETLGTEGLDRAETVLALRKADARALEILRSPHFFSRLVSNVGRLGLVGEVRNALALFWVGASRVREKPLSALMKGRSASGKNYTVNRVLKLFPKRCVHEISSMSERALNFLSKSELANSILYFYEIGGRSRSTHPNRLLLSEGKLVHLYTSSRRGAKQTREEVTGGPVACISTTTTDRLEVDDESRHLSLWVDESPAQTKRISAAYVANRPASLEPSELLAWQLVQRHLEKRKDLPIEVPAWFGEIADRIPSEDVRVRRYWPAFVEACKTTCLIRSFRLEESEVMRRGRLTVGFIDFMLTHAVFEDVAARSLCDRGDDEEWHTADMVARIVAAKGGTTGADASDLTSEPGVTSMDRAHRLLRQAAEAGTIYRCNAPEKGNAKYFLPSPPASFIGSADRVLCLLKHPPERVQFVHPLSGKWVVYERGHISTNDGE